MVVLLLACVASPPESGDAQGSGWEAYSLVGDWRLHEGDAIVGVEGVLTGEEVITFTADGEVLTDGASTGSWNGPWEIESDWPDAAEYEVNGASWEAVPRGDPELYQWYILAGGSTFGLYPAP